MAFEKTFFCTQCGTRLSAKKKCKSCGFDITSEKPYGSRSRLSAGGKGWSEVVNDAKFAGYQSNRRTYITLFTLLLVAAILAFLLLSGDLVPDKEGITVIAVLSAMFLFLALYSMRNTRKKGEEWIGTVEDKRSDHNKKYSHHNDAIIVRLENGKLVELPMGDNSALYDYFNIGDKLKLHNKPNLRALEKYDKRGDEVLFCPTCATLNDSRDNFCKACGSPLLKGR